MQTKSVLYLVAAMFFVVMAVWMWQVLGLPVESVQNPGPFEDQPGELPVLKQNEIFTKPENLKRTPREFAEHKELGEPGEDELLLDESGNPAPKIIID